MIIQEGCSSRAIFTVRNIGARGAVGAPRPMAVVIDPPTLRDKCIAAEHVDSAVVRLASKNADPANYTRECDLELNDKIGP